MMPLPDSHFLAVCRAVGRGAVMLGLCWLATLGNTLAQTAAAPAGSTPAVLNLRIVGGLADVNQYTRNEEPFWSKELARLSKGKYTAEIMPFDRSGVPGNDMLRLLQLGVVPFGTTLKSALSTRYPQFAANNLAGQNPDMPSLKKTVAAFRPYLEQELRTQHNVQMLALYVYPAQVLFCKQAFAQLADLKGRRVRVSTISQADFLGALGAQPVLTGFAEIMANMASNNIDCAVTGTMSGNTLGLHEVTSHIHTLPITWGLAIFGANKTAWDNLPPDLKALLSRELPLLEAAIWAESERETADGLACNVGSNACRSGRKGKMTQVVLSSSDEQLRRETFSNAVLPKWLERCGASCINTWRQTVGPATGILIKGP